MGKTSIFLKGRYTGPESFSGITPQGTKYEVFFTVELKWVITDARIPVREKMYS